MNWKSSSALRWWAAVLAVFLPVAAAAQRAEIRGLVVDVQHMPVRGASVSVGSHESVTDSLGGFVLRNITPGEYVLTVRHLAYSQSSLPLNVQAGQNLKLQVTLKDAAVELAPIEVEAMSAAERRKRGAGYARNIVGRAQIEKSQQSNMRFSDMLRTAIPNIRVRRLERVVGSPVCIELRTIRVQGPQGCLSPAVYLDGVPVTNPVSLYDILDLRVIESVEIIPASEAGVLYGSGALYGALLIKTRTPGVERAPDAPPKVQATKHFDWDQDPANHNTTGVFLSSAALNAAGVAVGVGLAAQCIELRKPGNDALITTCPLGAALAAAAGALVLPAIGAGLGARLTGRTDASQGQFLPAAIGSAMSLLPGYALVLSGYRNNSDSMKTIGYGLVLVGPPLIATTADFVFRRLRDQPKK